LHEKEWQWVCQSPLGTYAKYHKCVFFEKQKDFANSITFDFNTQTIFNVAIIRPLKAKTPIKITSPQK
jgi:hypothetical protein